MEATGQMQGRGSIPGAYTLLIAQELGLGDGGLGPLLEGSGLTEAAVRHEHSVLSDSQQVRILANALDLSGDPAFGFRLGRRLTLGAHGPLGFLISTSPDLLTALSAAEAYAPTRLSFLSVGLIEEPDEVTLVCTWDTETPPDVARCLADALSTVVLDVAGFILGRPATEIRVELPHPDPGSGVCELPAQVSYGSGDLAFRVPRSLCGVRNAAADQVMHELARTQCEALLAADPHDDSMRSRLERLMLSPGADRPGVPGEDDTAAALFISPRTLARRLGAEGTTFREVRDGVLARRAQAHLRDGLPVAAVASLLGYHDASGFRRAFRRWTGETPDSWRRGDRSEGRSADGAADRTATGV